MPDPVAVGVNMRSNQASRVIIEIAARLTSKGSWTMGRDESATPARTGTTVSLRNRGKRTCQQYHKKSNVLFHICLQSRRLHDKRAMPSLGPVP